jgi:hypothetical protein
MVTYDFFRDAGISFGSAIPLQLLNLRVGNGLWHFLSLPLQLQHIVQEKYQILDQGLRYSIANFAL